MRGLTHACGCQHRLGRVQQPRADSYEVNFSFPPILAGRRGTEPIGANPIIAELGQDSALLVIGVAHCTAGSQARSGNQPPVAHLHTHQAHETTRNYNRVTGQGFAQLPARV